MKKCILVLLIISLMISGCSVKNNEQDNIPNKKELNGAYVENDVVFPEEIGKSEKIMSVVLSYKTGVELFVYDSQLKVFHYMMKDNNWEKEEVSFLDSIKDSIDLTRVNIIVGEDNNYYVCYAKKDESYHLGKIEQFTSFNEITISDWNKKQNSGYYLIPEEVEILKNNIAAVSYRDGECKFYDLAEQGRKIDQIQIGNSKNLTAWENQVLNFEDNNKNVFIYDMEEKKLTNEISDTISPESIFEFYSNDEIYAYNENGIYQLKENVWQLIGDSSLNNLSNPEFIPLEAKHIENRIYVLYISQQSLQEGKFKEDLILKTYEYSKKIPNTKHTLKIWSLEENETIKAVLNSFRRENPDWQIIYEIATDVNGTKTKSDIIRQFNSEVYAGNGPDIIILDGLPIQTYVEKNILHDFSSEIIDQKSELLPAIQKNYLSKSCYALPSKIIIPLLVGEPTVLIENLDNFLEQSIKMPEMSAENIFDICFRFFSEGLELNKSKLKSKDVKEFLELCKKASKKWNYIKNPKIPYDYNGSWYELLTGETDIEFSYAYGLNQISNTLDAIEQTNSSYQIVENRFIPKGILGINNSSKNKEKAFEFIKKAIGQESQKNDLDDGFPVNVAALDSWKGRENNMMIGMGDSEETMQSVGQPSQNMLERFVEDIKKVEVPIVFDEVISEMLREETMKVIQDETTIEESVKRIMNRLELYYEE